MAEEFSNGRKIALVTGASSGIGLELAKVFAREQFNLILVARSGDKLNDLETDFAKQYGTQTRVIAKDLLAPSAPDAIFNELETARIVIDTLVNNAGFASYGRFAEADLQSQLQMMQLNIVALTHLTRLFLPAMVARRSGSIMNVASTAAFQPGPLMAVYYATKSFVLSFSEAVAEEVRDQGVIVSALCPGPTESGFQERAAMQESKLVQNGMMSSAVVAEEAYKGLLAGKTVIIPGLTNKVGALLPRFVPRRMTARMVMNMQDRVGH